MLRSNLQSKMMDVSKNRGGKTPKSSILIGFSIIFTIHFGGFPLFSPSILGVFPPFVVQHPDTLSCNSALVPQKKMISTPCFWYGIPTGNPQFQPAIPEGERFV